MLLRSRFQRFQHASGRRSVLRSFRSSRRSFQEHQRTRPPWRTSHQASHRSQARRGSWEPIELESGRRGEHAARGRPAGLRQAREISHARSVAGIDDVGALLEHGGARMPTCMHACACVRMHVWLVVCARMSVCARLSGWMRWPAPCRIADVCGIRHGWARAHCAGRACACACASTIMHGIYIDCTLLEHRGWLPHDG